MWNLIFYTYTSFVIFPSSRKDDYWYRSFVEKSLQGLWWMLIAIADSVMRGTLGITLLVISTGQWISLSFCRDIFLHSKWTRKNCSCYTFLFVEFFQVPNRKLNQETVYYYNIVRMSHSYFTNISEKYLQCKNLIY